ncbi:hypothetical protein [Clostridium sp.]|jgi:hypothetical protein|uniref:hypothetical protein n=1 Tax=Clostridium sp. TaxID=1506 RepID=UPI0025875E18|nr:hypothetical protein [Clostridium sp.]MDF2505375.1 hypothetical protein [Clostridium sp.]
MKKQLVDTIIEQTDIMFSNMNITLQTCDLNAIVCEMPIWKHLYHTLHSLDRWFINPEIYDEPSFHEENLNSLDIKSDGTLTKEELSNYFDGIKIKINKYLNKLTDDMLYKKPDGCKYTRLALVLGQYRHFMCHIGIINCSTISETGKWPRVNGLERKNENGYFE